MEIKKVIDDLPDLARILEAMKALGASETTKELGVDENLLNLSMHCAKDYRTRYTLFKLIDECGLLQDYLEDYPLVERPY